MQKQTTGSSAMLQQQIIDTVKMNNISQLQIAANTNIKQSTISRILSKKTKHPRYDTLIKINDFLHMEDSANNSNEPRDILTKVLKTYTMNQSELSAVTGIAQPTISRILNGYCQHPRYETLSKIAKLNELSNKIKTDFGESRAVID